MKERKKLSDSGWNQPSKKKQKGSGRIAIRSVWIPFYGQYIAHMNETVSGVSALAILGFVARGLRGDPKTISNVFSIANGCS
jgi:hypothetical protein